MQVVGVEGGGWLSSRFWEVLVQKPAAVVLGEDTGEAPRLFLQRLHVLFSHGERSQQTSRTFAFWSAMLVLKLTWISTTSTSPGSAVSISKGPVR